MGKKEEKKYSQYVIECFTIGLRERLISAGLFPDKFPPFLTGDDFYRYVKKPGNLPPSKASDYIRYSSMRNINVPRQMGIPEPFAYANLCSCLGDHWLEILRHFKKLTDNQTFKVSRIHLRLKKEKKSLFEMNYKNHNLDGFPEDDLVIRSRYIASCDISNCFPSIYSHSLSWALVGKDEAKKRSGPAYKDLWFNELDWKSRNIKNGETNGLLIGPHTSNLLSEIILVCIDYELWNKDYRYVRNIDDYTCFVKSQEEAEHFQLDLTDELRKFELYLNAKKSSIVPLPQATVKDWVRKVNDYQINFHFSKSGNRILSRHGIQSFMDFLIETFVDSKFDSAVLNYGIKMIRNFKLDGAAKTYFVKQVHHLSLLYPYLAQILDLAVFSPHKFKKSDIKAIASDIYLQGREKGIYEACVHSIFWAIKYKFKIDVANVKEDSIKSEDCIYMAIAFRFDSLNNKKAYLIEYRNKAKELSENDLERNWLFVYEVLPASDLPPPYKQMKKEKVTFFNPKFS